MNKPLVARRETQIAAPPATVFAFLTDRRAKAVSNPRKPTLERQASFGATSLDDNFLHQYDLKMLPDIFTAQYEDC